MTEEEQLENVRKQPHSIKSMSNPSLAAQKAALTYSGTLLHSINNLDPRVFDDPKVIHSVDLSLLFSLKHGYIRSLEDMITTIRSTGVTWDTLDRVENAMKRENIQENIQALTEDLGNLAELRLGNLGGLLRQTMYRSNRGHNIVGAVEKKFSPYSPFGPNSEIVTVPAVKRDLAKTIKKQFTADPNIIAAAVYLNNNPVIFMITDATNLRGGTRANSVAYDFTAYSEDFQEIMKAKTYKYRDFPDTSVRQEQEKDYSYSVSHNEDFPIVTKSYAGKLVDTYDLNILLDTAETIAKNQNFTMSLKFVKKDQKRIDIRNRRARITRGDILVTGEELKVRLAKYKNSKRPTAKTIEDFIKMSISGTADVIRFDDVAYRVAKSSYVKIDPVLLLQGIPFSVKYQGADPGDYRSVDVRFYFDRISNMIVPYTASWYIDQRKQEEILDPAAYLKINLKISTVEKREVLKKILENLKAGRIEYVKSSIRAVKKMNVDWPEIAQIEAVLEKNKINESSQDIDSMSEEEQIEEVLRNPDNIQYIENPSERVQLAAVEGDGFVLEFIINPSERVKLAAVKENAWVIADIPDPSLELILAAIQSNSEVIKSLQHIQTLRPDLFSYNEQEKRIILRVLLTELNAGNEVDGIISYLRQQKVKWPELEKIEAVARKKSITESVSINQMSEEDQIREVHYQPFKIRFIQSPSERVQLAAVNQDGYALVYIPNPSFQVQKAAILDDKWVAMNDKASEKLFDDPEVKQSVLRKMLLDLKSGDVYLAEYVEVLRSRNVKWPELDTIESALHKKQITERTRNVNK